MYFALNLLLLCPHFAYCFVFLLLQLLCWRNQRFPIHNSICMCFNSMWVYLAYYVQ